MFPVNTARLAKPTTHGYTGITRPDMFSYQVVHQHYKILSEKSIYTVAEIQRRGGYLIKHTFDPIQNVRPIHVLQEQLLQSALENYLTCEILTRLFGYKTSMKFPKTTVSKGSFAIGYQSNHNADEQTVRPIFYEHHPYHTYANIDDVMCQIYTPWISTDHHLQSRDHVDFTTHPHFVQWLRDVIPDPIDDPREFHDHPFFQKIMTTTRDFLSSLPVVEIATMPILHAHSRRQLDDIPPASWIRLVIQTVNESDYRIRDKTSVYVKLSEVQVFNFDVHVNEF
eukprot:GILJ01034309.1.p1 GENE.GILJ01034309.1~~GILJ01034309.1.p1  ORF type:complete len:282 (+),score=15.71 GILJ01034309.1:151-996(+)